MFKNRAAVTFSSEDVDKDGKKDFSVMVGNEKLFTLYDAKNLVLKIIGTAAGGIIAIVAGWNIL